MSEELQEYEQELEKLCADIRKGIDGLVKLNGAEKQNVRFWPSSCCNEF